MNGNPVSCLGLSAGALDEKTKELLGFVASPVLRCDDCIL